MKKKAFFIVIGIIPLSIALTFILKTIKRHEVRESLNPNTILFLNSTNFKTEDFKITWNALNNTESSIFESSMPTDLIFKEYGKNFFIVYYKEQVISKYIQFKHNNWHGHIYQFTIQNIDNKPQVSLLVTGPDATRVKKYF